MRLPKRREAIQTGNFGFAVPNVRFTQVSGGDVGAPYRAFANGVNQGLSVFVKIKEQNNALARADAENQLLLRKQRLNDVNIALQDRINSGEILPEDTLKEREKLIQNIPNPDFTSLDEESRKKVGARLTAINYDADLGALNVYQTARAKKAKNTVQERYNAVLQDLSDPTINLDNVRQTLDTENFQEAGRLAYGQDWDTVKSGLKKDITINYLQNQLFNASDNDNFKQLEELKRDVQDTKKYTDLTSQDRNKLAHTANIGLDRIESKWKAAQTQAKLAVKEQYDNLNDSLYWQMSKEGKLFSELDQNQLALLKPKDYEFFKNYKTVKSDNFNILEDATFKINNQEDIDLNSSLYRKNLTSSTIESLAKKKANLAANQDKSNSFFSTITLFNTRARASGIKQGTDDYVMLQNSTMQALDNKEKEKGRKLTQEEQLQVIDNQFVQGYIKGGGWIFGDSNVRTPYFSTEDKSKFYVNRVKDIPESAKTELERRFKARGITPTDEQLINSYSSYLQQGAQ